MYIWAAFFLAFAVSLDGFTVGITYGLKNIKIKILSLLIISLASGFTMLIAMSFGNVLTLFLKPIWAERIGALILILIGFYLFYQSLQIFVSQKDPKDCQNILYNAPCKEDDDHSNDLNIRDVYTIKIESLGLIINILKQPVKADLDYSGTIGKKEAVFLGIALAMDALGGGIGAGLAGYSPAFTSISTFICKFILLKTGLHMGEFLNIEKLGAKFKLLPGLILILLGIIQFM